MNTLIASPRASLAGILACLGMLLSLPAQALVISQVYGGGGNSGAVYANDFIELFNDSAIAIDLSGLSVQYASATGTTWQKTDLAGALGPYRYYLIQEAAGAGGGAPLPSPDAVGSIALNATNGKVALVNGTTSFMGIACPGASLLDFVGYGTANCYEGSAAAAGLSNTLAALRLLDGLTDSDDNLNDFALLAPKARNSATPQNIPAVTTLDPDATPLAEPSSLLLMLSGIIAVPWLRRMQSAQRRLI